MLYTFTIIVLLTFVLYFTVYNKVKLPKNIDSLINEVKNERLPEFVIGKTAFVNNTGVKIAYEIIENKT